MGDGVPAAFDGASPRRQCGPARSLAAAPVRAHPTLAALRSGGLTEMGWATVAVDGATTTGIAFHRAGVAEEAQVPLLAQGADLIAAASGSRFGAPARPDVGHRFVSSAVRACRNLPAGSGRHCRPFGGEAFSIDRQLGGGEVVGRGPFLAAVSFPQVGVQEVALVDAVRARVGHGGTFLLNASIVPRSVAVRGTKNAGPVPGIGGKHISVDVQQRSGACPSLAATSGTATLAFDASEACVWRVDRSPKVSPHPPGSGPHATAGPARRRGARLFGP